MSGGVVLSPIYISSRVILYELQLLFLIVAAYSTIIHTGNSW